LEFVWAEPAVRPHSTATDRLPQSGTRTVGSCAWQLQSTGPDIVRPIRWIGLHTLVRVPGNCSTPGQIL